MLDADPSHTDEGRAFRIVMVVLAVGGLLSVTAILLTWRFLYADAAFFLLTMWERGSLFVNADARWFALVASQWLPAAGMALGLRSPEGIALLYGINLWLNPALAVVGVWFVSGGSREATLVAALATLFLFQTTYGFIESEATVFFCVAAVWIALTLRRDFSPWILLLVLLMPFMHETYVLMLAPVLALFLARRRRYEDYYGVWRYRALLVTIGATVAYALASQLVTIPSDEFVARNRSYFIGGTLSLGGSPALVLTTLTFVAGVAHSRRPQLTWLTAVFYASAALLLALPFAFPQLIWPYYHYRARILHSAAALLVFAYLHARFVWHTASATAVRVAPFATLALACFLFQARVTWEWQRHQGIFWEELNAARGVVPFPQRGPLAEPRARQFEWSWTTPVRSIVFQAIETGEVRAILLNADTTVWQPFDPRAPGELPDLTALGVRYDSELTRPPR